MDADNKIEIYPSIFNPITFGHIDIIKRKYKLVNKLLIDIIENTNKYTTFNAKLHTSITKMKLKN